MEILEIPNLNALCMRVTINHSIWVLNLKMRRDGWHSYLFTRQEIEAKLQCVSGTSSTQDSQGDDIPSSIQAHSLRTRNSVRASAGPH